ncbi:hypothetical protein [Candidatus Nitrospira allomarina]|uniref:Nephrocystin 3-like N-terminal domain-containing protein n=1 Tax=Candidatus Nitrospira allomarina TaxID=3020900 RepID=A0AA96GLG1_9BACT|nr:hypothetical protein [Candidatus Nitrospira allomarina]WNM59726.1 hypothetical protein PP769_08220 [Candidatus Nitrospira allomarina]
MKRTPEYVVDRPRVFEEIDEWLSSSVGKRVFLIEGLPGSGKSVLAKILAGQVSPIYSKENALRPQGNNCTLDAAYFCNANDGASINPHHFVESISEQLAACSSFKEALLHQVQQRREISINVSQQIRELHGVATGVEITLGDISPEDGFLYGIQKPLAEAARANNSKTWLIMIDALDEATLYRGNVSILDLLARMEGLPGQVRFIVTTRPIDAIKCRLAVGDTRLYTLNKEYPKKDRDKEITYLFLKQLNNSQDVVKRLTKDLSPEDFAREVATRADGNFLYVTYMLPMLRQSDGEINLQSLTSLPNTLPELYQAFLRRIFSDLQEWDTQYKPILGPLAISQEALNEKQLASIAGTSESAIRVRLARIRELLDTNEHQPRTSQTWGIYHRSFADFLLDKDISDVFWCEENEQHQRIIAYCKGSNPKWAAVDWSRVDDYVLDFLIHHLFEAYSSIDDELTGLLNSGFLPSKLKRRDIIAILDDLRIALNGSKVLASPTLLMELAWLFVGFRDRLAQQIAPSLIPIYVKLGQVDRARVLSTELDKSSDTFSEEAVEAQKQMALALAEQDRVSEAMEIVSSFKDKWEKWHLADAVVGRVALENPRLAAELLEGIPTDVTLSADTCAALARHDDCLAIAIERARKSGPQIEAIALQLASRDLEKARQLIETMDSYDEDIGGVRFTRDRHSVLGKLACLIAESDPAVGWGLVQNIEAAHDLCCTRILIAAPLARSGAPQLYDCLDSLEHKPPLGALAVANALVFTPIGEIHEITAGIDLKREDLSSFADVLIDVISRLELTRLAKNSIAQKILLDLALEMAKVYRDGDTFRNQESAAEFIARWLATLDIAQALEFLEWVKKHRTRDASFAGHGFVAGVASYGVNSILENFQGRPWLADHHSYVAALQVLASQSFIQALRLIDFCESRYHSTRLLLIGQLSEHLSSKHTSELKQLLDRIPRYTETANFCVAYGAVNNVLGADLQDKGSADDQCAQKTLACLDIDQETAELHANSLEDPIRRSKYLLEIAKRVGEDKQLVLLNQVVCQLVAMSELNHRSIRDPYFGLIRTSSLIDTVLLESQGLDPELLLQLARRSDIDLERLSTVMKVWWQTMPQKDAGRLVNHLLDYEFLEAKKGHQLRVLLAAFLVVGSDNIPIVEKEIASKDEYLAAEVSRFWRARIVPEQVIRELGCNSESDDFFREYLLRDALKIIAKKDPERAMVLWKETLSTEDSPSSQEAIVFILQAFLAVSVARAIEAAHEAFPSEGNLRKEYRLAKALKVVACTVARISWYEALNVVRLIGDKIIKGIALEEVIENCLSYTVDDGPEKASSLVEAADALEDESCRKNAFEALLTHGRKQNLWSNANIAYLISSLAIGSRMTFLKLIGLLVAFLRDVRPTTRVEELDAVAKQVREILAT